MRTIITICLLALICANGTSQTTNTITTTNYVNEVYNNVFIGLPDYRQINSGAKFLVSYEGEWPAEMQGAFEYAIKLWEEVIPMTLPININAKIGSIRTPAGVMSKVNTYSTDYNGRCVNEFISPSTMVKNVCLSQYHSGINLKYFDEISDTIIFSNTDIELVYNSNYLDQYSFSLDGEPDSDKYDFVTVALRDIAIGLGFSSNLTADLSSEEMEFTDRKSIPFERNIIKALGTKDPHEAYVNATQGSLDLNIQSLKLYAPTIWDIHQSLHFFIPEEHPLSRLLSYDFGKGYVVRDLSGISWDRLFADALEWKEDIPVGTDYSFGSVYSEGSSEDILPYSGTVTIDFNNQKKKAIIKENSIESNYSLGSINASDSENDDFTGLIREYCQKYDMYSPSGPCDDCISVSALKNDGTWDVLFIDDYYPGRPLTIDIEKLKLNFADSEYARGTGGGLRYRFTLCEPAISRYADVYTYTTRYFTRDYKPQKPSIKYTKEISRPEQAYQTMTISEDDDYFVDVKVGISNIEGTKRVVVEQLDEGETLPFQYEVSDFRKGYFIANLDRECSTQLTVTSYNDNGFQRSNTITIPAIGQEDENLQFHLNYNSIIISGLSQTLLREGAYTYAISNGLFPSIGIPIPLNSNIINISGLSKGTYLLTIFKNGVKIDSFRFIKTV